MAGSVANKNARDSKLLLPFEYILQTPGKKIRTKLLQGFNHWLNIDRKHLRVICEIIEMMHNASLLMDDIEDHSVLRRGIPAAHKVFGLRSTIAAGTSVCFAAMEKLINELPSDKMSAVLKATIEQLLELHRGQGMDIYWRDYFICPSEEEYLHMIRRKTGGLFMLGIQLMQLLSEDKRDFGPLMEALGTYFQIRDDYMNLTSTEYANAKTYCEDFTEGKFSYPVVHAVNKDPDDSTLIDILRQRPTDLDVKKSAVQLLQDSGSLEYTKKTLKDLDAFLRAEIQKMGDNPVIEHIIDKLQKMNSKMAALVKEADSATKDQIVVKTQTVATVA